MKRTSQSRWMAGPARASNLFLMGYHWFCHGMPPLLSAMAGRKGASPAPAPPRLGASRTTPWPTCPTRGARPTHFVSTWLPDMTAWQTTPSSLRLEFILTLVFQMSWCVSKADCVSKFRLGTPPSWTLQVGTLSCVADLTVRGMDFSRGWGQESCINMGQIQRRGGGPELTDWRYDSRLCNAEIHVKTIGDETNTFIIQVSYWALSQGSMTNVAMD